MIPDNVEKIVMTKQDYDRNVEQLLFDKVKAEQELERYKNIVDELEKWLNETQINSPFIDEETIMEVRSKLKELKGCDK